MICNIFHRCEAFNFQIDGLKAAEPGVRVNE